MKALALGLLLLAGCAAGNTTFSVDGGTIRDTDAPVPGTPTATPTLVPTPIPTPTDTSPPTSPPQCLDPAAALNPAIADLLWTSESDYPWEYWDLPVTLSALPTPAEFLALIDHMGEPVEIRQVEDYLRFASTLREDMNEAEQATALQYQNLIQVLSTLYDDLVVYKVGSIQVKVFIVGISCERISGIRTLSIET